MTTLTTTPLKPLLEPLFAEAATATPAANPEILSLVESRLKPDALTVVDDADASPDYLAGVRSPAQGYLSVPFGDDVELSFRLG